MEFEEAPGSRRTRGPPAEGVSTPRSGTLADEDQLRIEEALPDPGEIAGAPCEALGPEGEEGQGVLGTDRPDRHWSGDAGSGRGARFAPAGDGPTLDL